MHIETERLERRRKGERRRQGIGGSGGEGERKIWGGEERKKGAKKGKGEGARSSGKGREEGNRRTERGEIGKREGRTHTRKHKDTQMNTDTHG